MSTISRPLSVNSLCRLTLALRPSRSITRKYSASPRITISSNLHRGTIASHLCAGLLGGSLVLVGAYTWYCFSPYKPIIETSRRVHKETAKFKDSVGGHAIEALKTTVKSLVVVVPGAGMLVDMAFDALGAILEQHKEEIDQIAAKALQEVQRIAVSGLDSKQTALAVMESMNTFFREVQALGTKAGTTVGPFLEKALGEISVFAMRLGPEAKQEIDRRMTEAQSTISQVSSSVSRTVEEKAMWLLKSFDKGDEKPTRDESNSEGK